MPARRLHLLCSVLAVAGTLAGAPLALAQSPTTPSPPTEPSVPPGLSSPAGPGLGLVPAPPRPGMPASLLVPLPDPDGTADPVPAVTNVSFIDPASPWNVVRLRYDSLFDSNRPTRAEYLITGSGPQYRGFKTPTPGIDMQEASLYVEYMLLPQFSVFIDAPWRSIDPRADPRYTGVGDISTGFKLLALQVPDFTSSFQLMVFAPTGKTQDGLGNGHITAQPGVLSNWRPLEHWPVIVEGQAGLWLPIDGSSFGGQMAFYGVGFSYGEKPCDQFWITPVVEFTGWTVLRGQEQVVYSPTNFFTAHAGSDSIVNGNLGVRAGFGERADVYVGYSRPFTGDVWWKELWRVELRLQF
jgi:hypothetical protein